MSEIFPESPLTSLPAAVAAMGALPVPVGPEPQALSVTLEKRTELLRIVQATARRLRKEADGRKAYGDRLKAENAELMAEVHQARKYIRAVEQALASKTPFGPRGQHAVLLAIGWLRNSLDDYRGRVDAAEVFARRTQARISALLVEPMDLQGCALCGVSEGEHGVRVTEGFEHEWKRPTDAHVRERRLMQQQLERSASGEAHVSELAWLRRRVADLEAERHSTNESLSEAAEALRAARPAEESPSGGFPPALPWLALMDEDDRVEFLDELADSATVNQSSDVRLAEIERTCATWRLIAEAQHGHNTAPGPAEVPHDLPLHHDYRVGHDLPETGGAQ